MLWTLRRWLLGSPRRAVSLWRRNFRIDSAAREAARHLSVEAEVGSSAEAARGQLRIAQQESQRLRGELAASTGEVSELHRELSQARGRWEEGLLAVKHAQEACVQLEREKEEWEERVSMLQSSNEGFMTYLFERRLRVMERVACRIRMGRVAVIVRRWCREASSI